MFGSRTLWADLLAAGLVGQLHPYGGAAVLGAGGPAFDGPLPVSLRLVGPAGSRGSTTCC